MLFRTDELSPKASDLGSLLRRVSDFISLRFLQNHCMSLNIPGTCCVILGSRGERTWTATHLWRRGVPRCGDVCGLVVGIDGKAPMKTMFDFRMTSMNTCGSVVPTF